MFKQNVFRAGIAALAMVLLMPSPTFGQTDTAAIVGVVRDASGAVLPGVTVEASSPALIERMRSVVTDDEGRYNIIELRTGVYVVTFSLSGFTTMRREGIELSTGFTATVNAQLAVGGLEETLTVSGASPIVDIQNTRQQRTITKEVIEAIPTGRTMTALAQLVPGLRAFDSGRNQQDVGGLLSEGQRLVIHGSRPGDLQWLINGLPFARSSGDNGSVRPDVGAVEEVNFVTAGNAAEYQRGGVVMNMIIQSGGNDVSGSLFTAYSGSGLQSNNLTDELRARRLESVNSLDKNLDVGLTLGGPIKRDKLWFFGTLRYWETDFVVAGNFHDSNLQDSVYTPDRNRPAHDQAWMLNQGVRLTWQAAKKHKVTFYVLNQPRKANSGGSGFQAGTLQRTPEAVAAQDYPKNHYGQAMWTSTPRQNLLLEAGAAFYQDFVTTRPIDGIPNDTYAITDSTLNLAFNRPSTLSVFAANVQYYRTTLSYITGSHNLKVGIQLDRSDDPEQPTDVPGGITQVHLNGIPSSIVLHAVPRFVRNKMNALLGIFVQDQWVVRRLTLNAGLRFDYHNSTVPAQVQPAGRFLPEREYAEIKNVPNWTDLYPRLGAAYDLFGTGKTVVKGTLNQYPVTQYQQLANLINPVNSSVNTATRTWTDFNGNFIPECEFLNPSVNMECGRLSELAFGTPRITTRYDPELLNGFGKRPNNWETSVSVQHELFPRVGVSAGYFRRWYGNFSVTDNLEVTPADFDPYCITSPVDPRLPGGGGQRICGLYNVTPSKFARSNNFVTASENFGKESEVYDGMDVTVNARLTGMLLLEGGFNAGRTRTNRCFVVDSPEVLRFCDVRPPLQTQVKLGASYTLPWGGVQVGGSLQSVPGPEITASYVARNAEIAPTLGRDLAAGPSGTTTVALIEPGTMYDERLTQFDLRMSKAFTNRGVRFRGTVDLYNVFNASAPLDNNNGFGPFWLRPTAIVMGRLVRFSVQVNY